MLGKQGQQPAAQTLDAEMQQLKEQTQRWRWPMDLLEWAVVSDPLQKSNDGPQEQVRRQGGSRIQCQSGDLRRRCLRNDAGPLGLEVTSTRVLQLTFLADAIGCSHEDVLLGLAEQLHASVSSLRRWSHQWRQRVGHVLGTMPTRGKAVPLGFV